MREADTGVTGCAFHHSTARSEQPAGLRVQHDPLRSAILDRAAWIHELRLAIDLASRLAAQTHEADQWRVADRIDEIQTYRHPHSYLNEPEGRRLVFQRASSLQPVPAPPPAPLPARSVNVVARRLPAPATPPAWSSARAVPARSRVPPVPRDGRPAGHGPTAARRCACSALRSCRTQPCGRVGPARPS